MYALIALLTDDGTVAKQASIECKDSNEVCEELTEMMDGGYQWQAITLIHIEDLPKMMDGATMD